MSRILAKALGTEKGMEDQIEALSQDDPQARIRAIEALGNTGKPTMVAPLIETLRDPDVNVREAAFRALGLLAHPSARDALRQRWTRGGMPIERVWNAFALVRIEAHAGARAFLARALTKGSARARIAATEALGRIGDRSSLAILEESLADEDWAVRFNVCKALGDAGSPDAVDLLLAALKDSDFRVISAASMALAKIRNPRAYEPLRQALDGPAAAAVAEALGVFGDTRAVPALIEALRNPDSEWRLKSNAVDALGALGDPRAIEPLLVTLEAEDPHLRHKVVSALTSVTGKHFGDDAKSWWKWWKSRPQDKDRRG
jgi:HEAT repeat protein